METIEVWKQKRDNSRSWMTYLDCSHLFDSLQDPISHTPNWKFDSILRLLDSAASNKSVDFKTYVLDMQNKTDDDCRMKELYEIFKRRTAVLTDRSYGSGIPVAKMAVMAGASATMIGVMALAGESVKKLL